jgi:tetratricopeptide (TPR) repeat protein
MYKIEQPFFTKKCHHLIIRALLFALCLSAAILGSNANARGWVGMDFKGINCTGLPSNYGPFDYTNYDHKKNKLGIVERYHFSPRISALHNIDKKAKNLYQNIDYTLRAFPNHHKALNSMMRLRLNSKRWFGTPMECYFKRAVTINKGDGISHLLFAIYLHRLGKYKDAEVEYKKAEKLTHSTELYYNYGLLLANLKRYKEAVPYAEKAYRRGYPFPGLKDQLKRAGHSLKLEQKKGSNKIKKTQ